MNVLKAAAAAFSLAGIVGCASPAYDVEVYLSPTLKDVYKVYPSVEVDIVGLDANAAERFGATSVDDYFSPNGALRASTPHATLRFSANDVTMKELDGDDPIWERFAETEADRLCLLANLPPAAAEPAGDAAEGAKGGVALPGDGRKIVIPLEKDSIFNPRRWFCWPTRIFEVVPVGLNARSGRPPRRD